MVKLAMKTATKRNRLRSLFFVRLIYAIGCIIFIATAAHAQPKTIKGRVTTEKGDPISGASIVVKGSSIGTSTNEAGVFTISAAKGATLTFSSVGYLSKDIVVGNSDQVNMQLTSTADVSGEVIVVGYGRQKKESVVGAISQTSGKVLQRAGGVSNIGAALTGNVPGVITVQGTGLPGGEDPTIYIRGQGTWNFSAPLVLVDGIERPMNGVDIGSVESISVLKDASATAVFGVKGANGVILITTKRGVEGKANINATVNSTLKIASRLPEKYDAYEALGIRNLAIERELAISPASWADYTPLTIREKYRYPANAQEAQQYPNVDWQSESLKKVAMAQNANVNISGGSGFVRYFTSVDYLHEGDIMKVRDNGKGYNPGFFYDRLNIRANLDMKITPTTTLTANISGLQGDKQDSWSGFEYSWYQSIYNLAPDLFSPQYADGSWGYYPLDPVSTNNSAQILANSGIRHTKTTQFTTDFVLNQDLGKLVKNLSFRGSYSLDNTFVSQGGQFDDGSAIVKYIYQDGRVQFRNTTGANQFDYVVPQWSTRSDAFQNGSTYRRRVYQMQLNHFAKIGQHNITAMGMFMRNESARGSAFPEYREDWVFRTTYNYASRYFAEFNGAYNGSQKFGPNYRFEFFPSAAAGWTVTNEKFMKNINWLTQLKLRGSYGLVGNDASNGNYLYATQWSYGGQTRMGDNNANSPYVWYRESSIGNPEIHWETASKINLGLDFSIKRGLLEGSIEVFKDNRKNILIAGGSRAVPVYFGGTPPAANLGKTVVKGYEIELKLNKNMGKNMRLWGNVAMTHAEDKVLDADDPQLLDAYLKQAGFQIGQTRTHVRSGYYNTWDDVYGSTPVDQNDNNKMPGHFNLIDYNGDGVINSFDAVPFAYPSRPQNTYNATFGVDFKRLSFMVQFYAVNNVTRELTQTNFNAKLNAVFKQGDYWTKDNTDAESYLPRWKSLSYGNFFGDFYRYDGSYVRLKTAEISYTLNPTWLKRAGVQSMRAYVNGNNLVIWSKMPDDREDNIGSSNYSGQGAYPTVRRINFGFNLSF
ncbi:MAG: SusC/RagA family TonB-linked outer membrane protein [Bacteroidota bacterium]